VDASVRVVVAVASLAGAMLGASLVPATPIAATSVALIALGVVCGEALRLSLPFRGHPTRLAPADAAVLAACVLATPTEVVLGAFVGALAWHVVDRLDPVELALDVGQFTVTAGGAAATFRLFVAPGTPLRPDVLPPYALAALVVMATTTTLVAARVASSSRQPFVAAVRRLAPPLAVLVAGEACLALLALGLIEQHAYLLPVVAVPLLSVMVASRQQAEARLSQDRARTLLAAERALYGAVDRADVDRVLVDGIRHVTGAAAAVSRDGGWVTPVPEGSRACAVDGAHRGTVRAHARDLGIAADAPAVAVAQPGTLAVAWGGELGVVERTEEWIERLVRAADERADRVRAQAALEQERATLRRVVDGTTDGIYVLDETGRITMVNPAMAALVGSGAADLIGRRAASAFGPGTWEQVGVRDTSRPESAVWRVAVAQICGAGAGDVVVGVVHDVSAERQLARMKDDMLAVVSHELRTPLTPIRAAAQLLRTRWHRIDEPTRQTLLGHLADRAEHLTNVVEDLLLVAQLSAENGLPPLPLGDVDIAAALTDHVRQQDAGRPGHAVVYDGPEHVVALTDAGRLRQVMHHLIDNACKFSPAGSVVTVNLDVAGGAAVIRVRDTGRGIAASDLDRIFERFERLEDPLVMQTSGAGLGLFIVQSLVTALRGRLRVESVVDRGTTMTVELPLFEGPSVRALLPRSMQPAG
jgi:signal transduction histidine kinase